MLRLADSPSSRSRSRSRSLALVIALLAPTACSGDEGGSIYGADEQGEGLGTLEDEGIESSASGESSSSTSPSEAEQPAAASTSTEMRL